MPVDKCGLAILTALREGGSATSKADLARLLMRRCCCVVALMSESWASELAMVLLVANTCPAARGNANTGRISVGELDVLGVDQHGVVTTLVRARARDIRGGDGCTGAGYTRGALGSSGSSWPFDARRPVGAVADQKLLGPTV